MKKTIKKSMALLLICVFVFAQGTALAAGPAGPQVMFNGTKIDFTDALPTNINGRIMVPMRAIFETFGADVDFDGATSTVTAKYLDTEIEFVVGSDKLKVTKNGASEVRQMNVVPYIDMASGRTYVPARFAAESFGYSVSWDSSLDTVVLIDFERMLKGLDEKLSIMNKLSSAKAINKDIGYKVAGNMNLKMSVLEDEEPVEMEITGAISGLIKGLLCEMLLKMEIDLAPVESMTQEDLEMLEGMKNITSEYKMDIENGKMYVKTSALDLTPMPLPNGGELNGDTWLFMDMDEILKLFGGGLSYSNLISFSNEYSMEKILVAAFSAGTTYTVDSYKDMTALVDFIVRIYGDDTFTVSNTTANNVKTTTYALKTDGAKMLADAAASMLKASDNTRSMLIEALGEADIKDASKLFSMEMSYIYRDDKYVSSKNDFKMDLSSVLPYMPLNVTMKTEESVTGGTTSMTMSIPEMMDMVMDMNIKMEPTNEVPDISIPDYDEIVSYTDLIALLLGFAI